MKSKKLRNCITRYEQLYYSTLRGVLPSYQSINGALPDALKGQRRIVATIAQDGIVVLHYPAEKDSVEFASSDLGVAALRQNATLGILAPVPIPRGHFRSEITGVSFERGSERTSWARMEITDLSTHSWSEQGARSGATGSVLLYVTSQLMGLFNPKPDQVLQALERAHTGFQSLLDSNPGEEDVQKYLTAYEFLLEPTAARVTPKVKLGAEHITDFVIEAANQEYILVEIETPCHKLFNQKGDPTKELTHALQQVRDWRQWVCDDIAYARRSLPGITHPNCWVIIGRTNTLSDGNKRKLQQMNMEQPYLKIHTYDDLLARAKRHQKSLQKTIGI